MNRKNIQQQNLKDTLPPVANSLWYVYTSKPYLQSSLVSESRVNLQFPHLKSSLYTVKLNQILDNQVMQ